MACHKSGVSAHFLQHASSESRRHNSTREFNFRSSKLKREGRGAFPFGAAHGQSTNDLRARKRIGSGDRAASSQARRDMRKMYGAASAPK